MTDAPDHASDSAPDSAPDSPPDSAFDSAAPARKSLPATRLAAIAAVLLVVLAGIDLLLFVRYQDATDRRDARAGVPAARRYAAAIDAASSRLPIVLTYRYDTIDTDIARISTNLTGPFREQFATFMRTVVKPEAVRRKLVTTAASRTAGVITAGSNTVTVLVFVDQTTSSTKDEPASQGTRIRVTMARAGPTWLIAGFVPT